MQSLHQIVHYSVLINQPPNVFEDECRWLSKIRGQQKDGMRCNVYIANLLFLQDSILISVIIFGL